MSGVSGLRDSRTLISSLLFAPILRRMNSRIGGSKVAGTSFVLWFLNTFALWSETLFTRHEDRRLLDRLRFLLIEKYERQNFYCGLHNFYESKGRRVVKWTKRTFGMIDNFSKFARAWIKEYSSSWRRISTFLRCIIYLMINLTI